MWKHCNGCADCKEVIIIYAWSNCSELIFAAMKHVLRQEVSRNPKNFMLISYVHRADCILSQEEKADIMFNKLQQKSVIVFFCPLQTHSL